MKIPMTHSYHDALTAIALLRVIDSKTLNLLFSSPSRRAQFVKKATGAKHIKEIRAEESRKQESKSQTLYVITKYGIAFLAEQNDCLRELLEADAELQIYSDYECRTPTRQRIAAMTTAVVLSHCAGASIPAEVFGGIRADDGDVCADDENRGKQKRGVYTLRDYYCDYTAKNEIDDLAPFLPEHQPGDRGYMVFVDRTTVKQRISEEFFGQNDFRPGRYAGMLESANKSLMLYTAPKFSMSWSKWLTDAEINAYRLWGRTQSITQRAQRNAAGETAALIVANAREFAYHYMGEKRKREKHEVFGGGFSRLYIIPNDPAGARYLAWLMMSNDADVESALAEFAVKSGHYRIAAGSGMLSNLYSPHDDVEAICGLVLDAKQIDRIAYILSKNPAKRYEIMCLDWQVDYYMRVLPANVNLRAFPSSILVFD